MLRTKRNLAICAAVMAMSVGLVQATALSGESGQVRCLPATTVAYGSKPSPAFSLTAIKMSEKAFVRSGEAATDFDFTQTAAEAAFAYDATNLYVKVVPHGRLTPTGEVVVAIVGRDRVARPFVDGCATLPWTELGGIPAKDIRCALDLAWPGLDRSRLARLPESVRRRSVHTTLNVLTDRPGSRLNARLASPADWARMAFGADARDAAIAARRASPTVDGDLAEWPEQSFFTASLLGELLGGRYCVRLATAFDDANFYVAAKLTHPDGVPVNSAPAATGAGYGGGDALQFRLAVGESGAKSFCAYRANDGAALTVDTQNPAERNLLSRGGRLSFGRWTGGYTMEIAVPWAAIGGCARTGDAGRITFQPWWNAPSDRFSFVTTLVLGRPPAKTVTVDSPRAGAVSLGIFDAEGRLVRTLLKADERKAGPLTEPWDLKDQFGAFVKAGEYRLKGLVTDGVTCDYRFSLGNPGHPAWPTPDGRGDWLSDEAPPQAVATDGETVFVAAPGSEKGFATMAIDRNGQRLWGVGEEFYPRCVSLSYLDGKLYALYSGPIADHGGRGATALPTGANGRGAKAGARGRAVIIAYDAKTGRHVDFSATNARTELGTRWDYREEYTNLCELIRTKSFAPENYIGQPRYWDADVGETDNAIGFAALPGLFAVSKFYEDAIELYESTTLRLVGKVAVEKPVGLFRLTDDTLLAVSGKSVLKLRLANGSVVETTRLMENLIAPVGITADRHGNVYVTEWRDRMCVAKFSPAGQRLASIGKPGGRPWLGRFDFGGMLLPHGLAVTDDGRLFVAEADMTPKRLSCWDATSGAFLRHWLGPTPYGGMCPFWIDPDEPGFYHASGCKFSYDAKTGAGDIVATEFRRMSADDPFMPNGASSAGAKVIRRGGETFVTLGSRNQTVWLRKVRDVYRSCAAVGGLHSLVTDDGTGLQCWDSDIGRHLYRNRRPACFKGHAGKGGGRGGDNFAWSDLNGDGLVQPEEMTWHETLGRGGAYRPGVQFEFYNGWGAQFAADGTAHWAGYGRGEDILWELRPSRWTSFGPVYDIGRARAVHREPMRRGGVYTGVWTTDDGAFYAVGSVGSGARMNARAAIAAFAPDGTLRWEWAASAAADRKDFAASGINGVWQLPELGEVLCTWNWWWNYRPYFLTADGLYVGTFGEETSLGPAALWSESATHYFQTKDGTPYLVNGANESHHVFAVKGLENVRRFAGEVTVTEGELARAASNETIPVRSLPPKGILSLDGRVVRADDGRGHSFAIGLKRAGESLILEADVDDPTPMLQKGTDYRTLFITGDCVDLMLATDPSAPANRRAAAVGDKRILFSEMEGRPIAVLYEPVTAPRAEKPHRLMAATIDRITRLDEAEVKIVRRAGGYRLTAKVPMPSPVLRGDVGVVFSDAVGGREKRLYHYNQDTFMTADLTTEATLQPAQWGDIFGGRGTNSLPMTSEGWEMSLVPSDSRVTWDDCAYVSEKSLLIETPSHVSVGQTVRLPADADGRRLRFRAFLRAEGLTGPADAAVWLSFRDARGKVLKSFRIYRKTRDSWDWLPSVRADTPGPDDAIDVEIPAGSKNVRIDFKVSARGAEKPCRVWFDAVDLSVEK